LPTSGAAKYTGGLSVHKFIKVVTWQKAERGSLSRLAEATANISRIEGMEGHALSADVRLQKYRKEEY
jgi:sulfopropanediol 3-dehydrogenase